MNEALSSAIGRAAAGSPMGNGAAGFIPGRTLRVDGDGIAYYCAGKDGSDPADAKKQAIDKIASARRACGAEKVIILLTASGSTKGGRYAAATVKPYQGQRVSSRRPDNWRYLRNWLEDNPAAQITLDQEADDLFSQAAEEAPEPHITEVIYTQDKDMRMIPGLHLDWVYHTQTLVAKGTWAVTAGDKLYGRKWFWMQMLHGDGADNIPGLPFTKFNGKVVKIGPVGAFNLIGHLNNEDEVRAAVFAAYESCYGGKAGEHMAEQAQLLWMQRSALPLDVFNPGGPLHGFTYDAIAPLAARITEAQFINDLANKTQNHTG